MTIKEIARRAGVSVSTVSKIINQKDSSISDDTREKVMRIVREYNYTPYGSVPSAQKTWRLGVLFRSSSSLDSVLDGIVSEAQKNGYSTIICNSASDAEQELKSLTLLCKDQIDGIIWEPISMTDTTSFEYINKKEIPYITLGPDGDESSSEFPYTKIAYHMTQTMIEHGHHNIACLVTPGRCRDSFIRGYNQCLFDHHISLDKELVFTEFSDEIVFRFDTQRISAVISSNYLKSLEFYQYMEFLHYNIPNDFSLISLKSDKITTPAFPKISTYTNEYNQYGQYLCSKIIDKIESRHQTPKQFEQDFRLDSLATISAPFQTTSKKITVVGSINMDTYLNVASLPHTRKTVSTLTSFTYPGGKALNQSIAATRLGHRVSLIGNVGADLDSIHIYKTLKENNVDATGVKRCPLEETGKAYIFIDSKGDSMISLLSGANYSFSPTDIRNNQQLFKDAAYCLLQSEIPLQTIEAACLIAHEYGAKTILKPSSHGKVTEDFLSKIDILIPNEDELMELCPDISSMEQQAAYLLNLGIEIVIVTLGGRGCYVRSHDLEQYIPAANFQAIDTTGASDAFISAFASYLLYGYSVSKAVRIAVYAAGFCVAREGVVSSLVDKNSLEAHINQQESDLLEINLH
ncbi:MAG: PfkB family carbohydrate kinase [Hespellia sp.]|nr:PfkB family carbohydrate kinase [Hespellia sp.]